VAGGTQGEAIRVLVVAEIRAYREALMQVLALRQNIEVLGTAATSAAAAAMLGGSVATVVLLDVSGDGAIEAARCLRRKGPSISIVALGLGDEPEHVIACAEAGIAGYVPRDGSLADLVRAIEGAPRGEMACSPRIAGHLLRHVARLADQLGPPEPQPIGLTAREAEILELIDDGLSNKEIARRLVIEIPTVKNHVHHILEKLHVRGRAEAAAQFRRGRITVSRRSPAARHRD
jgi:DNA-binding NarL/FixJ family response regulator